MSYEDLHRQVLQLRQEAEKLAGGLTNLAQRATVYRHLFLASGGNHTFPLIAAHGALWAGSYFRFGMRLGAILSAQYLFQPELRRQQLQKLSAFADAFRDINRRVCIDTYVNFHFARIHGRDPLADQFVSTDLLDALNRMHTVAGTGRSLTDNEKRMVFESHFRNEQRHVVGPTIGEAVEKFDWPLVRAIDLRPVIRFAYFPSGTSIRFSNFAMQEQRITNGFRAFEIAMQVGWDQVDAALKSYQVLPGSYFETPSAYFDEFRYTILTTS